MFVKNFLHFLIVVQYCLTIRSVRNLSGPGQESAATLSRQTERTEFMAVFPDIARDILFNTSSQVKFEKKRKNVSDSDPDP